MTDRVDEWKGKVKKGVGDLTGDEQMKREGQAEEAAAKAKREAEGALEQGKGKAEEAWGDITDDPERQASGEAEQTKGDIRRTG